MLNSGCPYIIQYNACNIVQFTSAGKCRCCNKMAVNNAGVVERVPCPGRKIWEFAVNSNKLIVKHYGEHTCTSTGVMPFTAEEEFRKRPSTRICELRRDILGDMIRSGATNE